MLSRFRLLQNINSLGCFWASAFFLVSCSRPVVTIGTQKANSKAAQVETSSQGNDGSTSLELAASGRASFSFTPNQLAANEWYKLTAPASAVVTVVNGHLDESFGNGALWPNLLANLKAANGTVTVFAAEIGYLSTRSGFLSFATQKQIPLSVELPGFTQCKDGYELARAELLGERLSSGNLFCNTFGICSGALRKNPDGVGWFVTKDDVAFVPREIVLDERIPNLLPHFNPITLAQTSGSWSERKAAAKVDLPCAQAFNPGVPLLQGLQGDYLEYLRIARQKWATRMPVISLHWNVTPGWEWRDEACLDGIQLRNPGFFQDPANLLQIRAPCYNSVEYLKQTVQMIQGDGFTLNTVFMDVDWTYDTPYVIETLKRQKTMLAGLGVQMGINLVIDFASVGPCPDSNCEVVLIGNRLVPRRNTTRSTNVLYEDSIIQISELLKREGIIDTQVNLRVGSWSARPQEIGSQVSETIGGSLAHAANRVFSEYVGATPSSVSVGTVNPTPTSRSDGFIKGDIDGVFGAEYIQGWACQTGNARSIKVHVYVGGSAGTGVFAGEYLADRDIESGVSAACETVGVPHRFRIPTSGMAAHSGKTVFVHGISPTGAENRVIYRSGTFRIP